MLTVLFLMNLMPLVTLMTSRHFLAKLFLMTLMATRLLVIVAWQEPPLIPCLLLLLLRLLWQLLQLLTYPSLLLLAQLLLLLLLLPIWLGSPNYIACWRLKHSVVLHW